MHTASRFERAKAQAARYDWVATLDWAENRRAGLTPAQCALVELEGYEMSAHLWDANATAARRARQGKPKL